MHPQPRSEVIPESPMAGKYLRPRIHTSSLVQRSLDANGMAEAASLFFEF